MNTERKDFKALSSIKDTFDGQTLREWIGRNLQRETDSLIGEHNEVATRHLQGRAQILREILLDMDTSSDIMRGL